MAAIRKPYQGITNIIRFNWHYYLIAALLVLALVIFRFMLHLEYWFYLGLLLLIIIPTSVSLLVSFFIYDVSGFYKLKWLDPVVSRPAGNIVNINAGFDETSALLQAKFPEAAVTVFDFYDPAMHTEISIRRARQAYPPHKNSIKVNTATLPLSDGSINHIFVIFAAHEIRNDGERALFFAELNRVLLPGGKIIIVEHIRDILNFIAYSIGAFHFLPAGCWMTTFNKANLTLARKIKNTPFVTTFILTKNGDPS